MDNLVAACCSPSFASSCLKDWEKFGKKNFLLKCRDGGPQMTMKLLTDLLIKMLAGEGKLDILSKLLTELSKNFEHDAVFESKLMDTLWMIDTATSDLNSESVRDRYFRILHLCKSHVSPALMAERLSEETLENMSLIQSKHQFQTRYVRTKTRLFFKQQKFNLLREENEGYAKLITELCQTIGPMDAVMMQVRSLIGYFDLDPNRVLDLLLDACEFRENMSQPFVNLIRLYNPDKMDLTHVLGHKFHFTQEPGVSTPSSLYRIAAILIQNGLVSLDGLYGHLQPSDSDIQSARSRQISTAKSYRPSATSTLQNSSALNTSLNNLITSDMNRSAEFGSESSILGKTSLHHTDSIPTTLSSNNSWLVGPGSTNVRGITGSPVRDESRHGLSFTSESLEDKEVDLFSEALYENNQKLELCTALLQLGDWTNAQLILDRFPGYWATTYPPLAQAICSLLHRLIEPLYVRVCPLPACLKRNRSIDTDETQTQTNSSGGSDIQKGSTATHSGSLVPVHDFQALVRSVFPIAAYLGPNLSTDIVLMTKFCRLGYAYFSEENSRPNTIEVVYQGFFNLLDEVLLPSLSLVDANCCLAEELWQLMRFLPYDHRYRLYGQWKHDVWQTEPSVMRKQTCVLIRTKAVMKRLSTENVKPMGRQLGKLSHSNPGPLFDNVLNSVQLYPNLIKPVVDALKYVSSLGYDILTYCIIEALTSDENKLEELQFSQGFQALSTFTGLLCKKYQFDLSGLLQYILNQLKDGKSYDLLILREMIHAMSGIDVSEEMTDEQLESMSGGELLLQEGGYYAQIRNTRKNANRLKTALVDFDMVMPFVFLMAQQRDAVLYLDDPERHVKLAGRLYDQCQGTLVQFITFLSLQLTRDEMQAQCLPIEQMMGEFHVSPDTAFCLHRSFFEQQVARLFEDREQNESNKSGQKSRSSTKALFAAVSQHVCAEIAASLRPLYPVRVWDEIGTHFFVTFWSLQSSDLVVPEAAYQRQIQTLREQMQQLDSTLNSMNSAKRKRETERLQMLIDKLGAEQLERHEHVARVRAWLLAERDNWFQARQVTKTDTITQFLQLCIYPRACFTAADAIYAAQFMHVLHQLKTSRFSTLICLDRIFNDITLPTSMCTEDEAHRYGRFLCAVLELVMRWHASEEIFNNECGQYPGFVTVFRKGSDANTKADQLQYENYRHVVHKWHYRITKATVACLESGSYVQIRNALIVLARILPQYPRIEQFGNAVERRVKKLIEDEKGKRPDLRALAFSYAGLMRPRDAKWVTEEEFHLKENKPNRIDTFSGRLATSAGHASSQIPGNSAHHTNQFGLGGTQGAVHTGTLNVTADTGSYASSSVRRIGSGSTSSALARNPVANSEPRSRQHPSTQAPPAGRIAAIAEPTPRSATTGTSSVVQPVTAREQTTSAQTRSAQRIDPPLNPPQPADQPITADDDGQGSKRRRVESTNTSSNADVVAQGNTNNSNPAVTNLTGAKLSAPVEESRESRKVAKKRMTQPPVAGIPVSSQESSESHNRPAVNTIRTIPSTDLSSSSSTRSTTGQQQGVPISGSSNQHQYHHHSSSSRQSASQPTRIQRSSSTTSADSNSLDDEHRSHSGVTKKMKRAHHHHRHSNETSLHGTVSPTRVVISPSSSVTIERSPGSRHSRR